MRIFMGIIAVCVLAMCFIVPSVADDTLFSPIEGNVPMIGMANPAAVWAVEMGYEYVILSDEEGNQYGVCILPDGTQVDAWELFRIMNPPEEPVAPAPDPAEIWVNNLGYEDFRITSDLVNSYRTGVSSSYSIHDTSGPVGDSITASIIGGTYRPRSFSFGAESSPLISDRLSGLAG